jgi:predicted nucleic acid-binding protein
MYLLDTNVIAELRKAGRADTYVVSWAESVRPSSLFLSVITIMVLGLGILRVARRDHRQGDMLRAWLEDRVLPAFADHVLPIDTTVARRCAELHVPHPRNERDASIAATALVHGMTVVTGNGVDFHATGVAVIDPWIG